MISSLVNKQFYATHQAEIALLAQANGVGNVVATDLGTVYQVRGLDANAIVGAQVYELPDRAILGNGAAQRAETDDEYRARVDVNLVSAINRVKANVYDAVVLPNDEIIHVMNKLAGWPRLNV